MIRFCKDLATISVYLLLINFDQATGSNLANNVEGFKSVIRLPRSQWFREASKPKKVVSVNDYGAKGNGFEDDTQAFKDAWDVACSSTSRPVLEIPAGNIYLVKPIDFCGPCRSKLTLSVAGTIIAPIYPEIWDGLNPRKWLYFHGLDHFVVDGGGTINGMGEKWWNQSCKINPTNPCQHAPTALTFHKCTHLKVKNLMIMNSQQMHMSFTNCTKVKASCLKVIAPAVSPNTDGIHISASTRVMVEDSVIATGDDCISIVSQSSIIRIRNIHCGPGHGISIGSLGKSNSWAQVSDVHVDGAFISNTENGLRIKTWQGGSGFAKKISFRNVLMKNVSNPIILDQYYCDSLLPCANQTLSVKVDNVSFVAIKGTSATEEAIRLACSDTFPCQNIHLEDIQLFLDSRGPTTAYCWNAFGSSYGLVYPRCSSWDEAFIEQKAHSSIARQSLKR